MSTSRHVARLCVPAILAVLLAACGQTKMVQTSGQMRQHCIDRNYTAALAALRASKNEGFKEQDRVVFWMNEGMLLHLTGQYKASVDTLNKAERRAKELYTKSISKGIKAAFTSDAATDYEGEDYENVLVFVVKALDFLAMGNKSGALIEARKINEKLKLFNTKYQGKFTYNQDAFAHWLMGMLFEMDGSFDDARIAYLKAWETYKTDFAGHYGMHVPNFIKEDLARAAILSGAREVLDERRSELGARAGQTAEVMKSKGEIVLFHLNGEGPSKTDFFLTCVINGPANWFCDAEPGGEFMKKTTITIAKNADVIKVAFPQLVTHTPATARLSISVAGVRADSEVAYPLNAIARKALADKTSVIFKDTMIRVVTKYLATKAAGGAGEKAGGKGLSFLTKQVASAAFQAMEEADKRCWTTLPARIDVVRAWVDPGEHALSVRLANGRQVTIPGVKVAAGKRVFVSFRTMP